MSYQYILFGVEGPVATITLNRPDRMNAYVRAMIMEVRDAFHRADRDDEIRAIILTGAGERAFCAGADISDGDKGFRPAAAADPTQANAERLFIDTVFNCRKPSIAAINGAAVGIGATLTLPFDFRICADTARFGFAFARRGVSPEAGSAWFLPQLVGVGRALHWCLTGRLFGAAEALSAGLVSEVTTQLDLMAAARRLAMEIAEWTSPVSIAVTRQMIWRCAGLASYQEMDNLDSRIFNELSVGVDVAEGARSFLEKRAPRFPGRVSTDMPPTYPWWPTAEDAP